MRDKKYSWSRVPKQREIANHNEYDIKLNAEQIENLIRLLEFAERDISKEFKKLSVTDSELKDINWYYKLKSRDLRLKLRAIRGW